MNCPICHKKMLEKELKEAIIYYHDKKDGCNVIIKHPVIAQNQRGEVLNIK